jgi:hypothetical protein
MKLPSLEKKLRVGLQWALDVVFGTALHHTEILTDGTESLIDALDEGTGCDIPVTKEQYSNFYGKGRQQEPV